MTRQQPRSAHQVNHALPRVGIGPNLLVTPVGLPLQDPGIQEEALPWNGAKIIPTAIFRPR